MTTPRGRSLGSKSTSALLAGTCLALVMPLTPALAQTAAQPPSAAPADQATPAAPPAQPATGAVAVPEIVVTAQRRSESLQNVPVAVPALSGGALSRAGVTNTADLNNVVPGLNFTTSVGAYGLPTIRGIGSTSQGPGVENPVATYIDGVYMVSAAGSLLSLHDISQVAVLKGPQGTLFGRNATGGLIQVTTQQPSQDFHADIDGTIGNRQASAENIYLSGGLTDKLFANFAASNDDLLQGFGKNLATGQNIQTHRSSAMRGKLLWEPDDQTQITLSADYSKYKASDPALRTIGNTILDAPTPGGPSDIDSDVQPSVHVEQWGTSLTARRDFSGFQVLSISAYRQTALDSHLDGDQTILPVLSVENAERDSQFSQELQFLSTNKGAFSWVAGAYYLHSRGAYDPVTLIPEGSPGPIYQNVTQDLDSYSLFGQGTYKIDPATNLTAGIRYTLDHRTIAGTDLLSLGNGISVPAGPADNASKDFSAPTARASLDHRFSPELLAYISYNRGFKSGTFSPQNFPVVVVQPETLNAYEAGIKTDLLDRRVRFNLAGFYYDYSNKQVQQINNGIEYLYDAKKVEMYGMDADFTIRATENLQINGGVSAIHSDYSSFTNAPVTVVSAAGGNIVGTGDVSGNSVEDTPTWTLNIGPSYKLPTRFGTFTGNVNYYHNSGWYAAPDNRIRQPAYDLVNADILFVPDWNSHISIDVWGKNLTDTVYSLQLNETQTGDNRVAGMRQTYGITVGLHY